MSTELHLERRLPGEPDRVQHALTDPGALDSWFWPARMGTRARTDPRPGGEYRIEATSAGMAVSGVYRTVDPGRLAFTWRWDGEPDPTLVTVELAPEPAGGDPAGTVLRLAHEGFPDERSRDEHIAGWTDCLDRLPRYLTGGAD